MLQYKNVSNTHAFMEQINMIYIIVDDLCTKQVAKCYNEINYGKKS